MANVTFDDRSFIIDGRRIWLVSGSVHYWRIARDEWRDRLIKARRAGLNCISTYLPWNVHETREGEWTFEDEKDLPEFIRLAQELDMYVILRPGPYVGADLDFGGVPAWLKTKRGVNYRTSSATFTHYFDKHFRRILPPLAELQVSRGGNIVLIQCENEYNVTTMPDRLNYLSFINQLFRRSGFDIPIVSCNEFSDPPAPDTVETVNAGDDLVQQLKRMRLRQPNAPLMMTELLAGTFDTWEDPHTSVPADEAARRAMQALGCGGQYNIYMFAGGTNFAFSGGRHPQGQALYQAATYDYDAPIAEGGELTEKYYRLRPINLMARHLGGYFATSILEQPGVTAHSHTSVLNLTGTRSSWAIISNNGDSTIDQVRVSLPEGEELDIPLGDTGAAAIPMELDITSKHMLDYSNLTPLGLFDEKLLVLYGPAGCEAKFSIDRKRYSVKVPADNGVEIIKHQGVHVAIINSAAAMRTWVLENYLLIGPDFVGEDEETIVHSKSSKPYSKLGFDGKTSSRKANGAGPRKGQAPRLANWKRITVSPEAADPDSQEWTSLKKPADVDELGLHYGYVWYRAEVKLPRARKRNLFFPECEDRATVFVNGELLGTWGRGPDATREPMKASLKRGRNIITVLVDNLGRFCGGSRLGEPKGLYGDIYDAKKLKTTKLKLKQAEGFQKRLIPRQQMYLNDELKRLPVWTADVSANLTKVAPIHMSFSGIPHHLAVLCNDRVVGFYQNLDRNFGEVTLSSELRKGKNAIRLVLWGDVKPESLKNLRFHLLNEPITADASWSYRSWNAPTESTNLSGRDLPAWYRTQFKCASNRESLFVRIGGSKKGQLILNGRNLSRFYIEGAQQDYYLPAGWLQDENELWIFEEQGKSPAPTKLRFLKGGTFGSR